MMGWLISSWTLITIFDLCVRVGGSIVFTHLAVNHLRSPLGIDTPQPRFRWALECSTSGGIAHHGCGTVKAYRILVASSKAGLHYSGYSLDFVEKPDMWDSGIIEGSGTSVKYSGVALKSQQLCHFRVQIFDAKNLSVLSHIDNFEMGLLDAEAWGGAKWIARTEDSHVEEAPYLRKQFSLLPPSTGNNTKAHTIAKVERARLYVCGLGYAKVHLNGCAITRNILDPVFTRYDKRTLSKLLLLKLAPPT